LKSKRGLLEHVEQLASNIGERKRFPSYVAAGGCVSTREHEWEHQGYAVERLAYDVSGFVA
jgi:hypothetical protein